MDGARLSRFPHLSWLRFAVSGHAGAPLMVPLRGVSHTISLTLSGEHDIRWTSRGVERAWRERAGVVHFRPVDDDEHVFVTRTPNSFTSAVIVIPRHHLDGILSEEGVAGRHEPRRLLVDDDAVLRQTMVRLASLWTRPDGSTDGAEDEAGRRLVLRIAELCGAPSPDWNDDDGVFDRIVLRRLVEQIDGHLSVGPSLGDLASSVGLSPSHFARKFRHTIGLSLHRFVNRRRLQASKASLQADDAAIATIAARLGFSSQSHFTRLFSALTGMTPARYRRTFRPTVG